ncbi:hypothetical protein ES705_19220 [subsurface metagenome]
MKSKHFNVSRHFVRIILLFTIGINNINSQDPDLQELFKNPPKEYSMLPLWSWNGTLEAEKLIFQVDQMLDKGIEGAFMHARSGINMGNTPYFSDGWWEAVDTVVKYSAEKGFLACLYDEDKWPSGSAGGRTVAENPEEYIKKALVHEDIRIEGPATLDIDFDGDIVSVIASKMYGDKNIDSQSMTDLSSQLGGSWDVPGGEWMVNVFRKVKQDGIQIDYLDEAAVGAFIKVTHDEYEKRVGEYFGTTIPGIFFDEIRCVPKGVPGGITWTDDFAEKFIKIKGYDIRPQLPLLLYKGEDVTTAKLRYDFFDVVSNLYNQAWFKQYYDWGERTGIWVTGHTEEDIFNYISQGNYFNTMGQLQVPGTDNEYFRYGFPRRINWYKQKQSSSIAHLYGRKRNMVEAMGGGGYIVPLDDYRFGIYMMGAYSINMFISHLYHYDMNSAAALADWPPSWDHRNPYWKYFRPLSDLTKRVSLMNTEGHHVCDIAILYPHTTYTVHGHDEDADKDVYAEIQGSLLEHYYDYDIINPESLINTRVENGHLKIHDEKYRMLILPNLEYIKKEVYDKIEEFVADGGIVLAVYDLPIRTPQGKESDMHVNAGMRNLFGMVSPSKLDKNSPDKNRYYDTDKGFSNYFNTKLNSSGGAALFTKYLWQVPEIMDIYLDADIRVVSQPKSGLKFNHRQMDGMESYFFVNETKQPGQWTVSVRESGVPELWDPETGEVSQVHNYRITDDGRLETTLFLNGRSACYLMIREGTPVYQSKLIRQTTLDIISSTEQNGELKVNAWVQSGKVNFLTVDDEGRKIRKEVSIEKSLPTIALGNEWDFILTRNDLDYVWETDLEQSSIEIPVMDYQRSPVSVNDAGELDNKLWKSVKVIDDFSTQKAGERLISSWDGSWISYYELRRQQVFPEAWFRKQFTLSEDTKSARIQITADEQYELFINGYQIGKDNNWETVEDYNISEYLESGSNEIKVRVTNSLAMLAQIEIISNTGSKTILKTDETWETSSVDAGYKPTFVFCAPPLGKWGAIERNENALMPCKLWYKGILPPGTLSMDKPEVNGTYEMFVNGHPVDETSEETINLSKYINDGRNTIMFKVNARYKSDGFTAPIKTTCVKTTANTGNWKDLGMWWYSGRAIYSTEVNVSKMYLNPDTKMVLDLGKVGHFAELWVNGELVRYFAWGPFDADVSQYLKTGKNEIVIVVSNLLANKGSWNIPDANIDREECQRWHKGRPLYEPDKLESGLFGPVELIPYSRERIVIGLQD